LLNFSRPEDGSLCWLVHRVGHTDLCGDDIVVYNEAFSKKNKNKKYVAEYEDVSENERERREGEAAKYGWDATKMQLVQ
jgi:hypothetical protein